MKQQQHVVLRLEGMSCEHCARGIEQLLREAQGINEVEVSYAQALCRCSFDASQTDVKTITARIEAGGSYRVREIKTAEEPSLRSNQSFDLIIIGGGSAAFSAAIKAESLGLRTLMVNAGLPWGGCCVNVGCIPSKHLIRAAENMYRSTHSSFSAIKPRGAELDFASLIRDNKELVTELRKKKYLDVVKDFSHLSRISGWAEFEDEHSIRVDGKAIYSAKKILIATGSSTRIPAIEGLETTDYLTHISLFELEEKPPSLTILGAGYIGLELAQAYSRLGVKVRIMQFRDRVLRKQTPDISALIANQLKDEGIELFPGLQAFRFEQKDETVVIHARQANGSVVQLEEKGKIVLATGTQANTSRLGLERIGLQLNDKGQIVTNEYLQTNLPHIYAAGDVTNTPAYVYTAAHEGKTAVENAFAQAKKKVDYSALPWVIFTDPQIAGVGIDEAEAAALNLPFEVSKLSLEEVPRALTAHDTRGFIKLIRNPETDRLLGARLVAPEGGELITLLSMAIKHEIPVKELAESLYPYLTLSEGIKLTAIAFGKDISKLSCCAS